MTHFPPKMKSFSTKLFELNESREKEKKERGGKNRNERFQGGTKSDNYVIKFEVVVML